jgi:hypothetical protein
MHPKSETLLIPERELLVEKMLYAGTDPKSYITEYTLVNEEKRAAETCFGWDPKFPKPCTLNAQIPHGHKGQVDL